MKKTLITICLMMSAVLCHAQNKEQEGLVKTRGRLDSDGKVVPGVAVSNASIILKGGNTAVSEKDGEFSILLPEDKYYLQNVEKEGYIVVDQDILSKQYSYSNNPLVLVMETPQQQMEDELAAERKIRRNLTRQLHEREDEIERLKEENKISAEQYRAALNKLYEDQENNEKLISDMAERYSKIDFDQIDEFYVQVSNYILNGELTKADSMLNTKGNIGSDIENLNHLKEVNAKERAELSKRQRKLEKSEAMAQYQLEEIAQRCYSKYEIFKMQHQNDSALYYLELRASLDTMNVEWIIEAEEFVRDYIVDYEKAIEYCKRALKVCYTNGENDIDVSIVYGAMGIVYNIWGKYDMALECHTKAKNIKIEICGEDSEELSTTYSNLGLVFYNTGKYDKAMNCFQKALELGNSATTYNNIAALYSKLDMYEDALCNYQKAIDIQLKLYGEVSPDIATSYNNIGGIYHKLNDFERALKYLNMSLELRMKMYGESHLDLANSYINLGAIYGDLGNFEESMNYYKKSHDIYINLLGSKNIHIALISNNIGNLYRNQGKYEESLDCFQNSLNIRQTILDENHPDIGQNYNNLGVVYKDLGKYNEAIMCYTKALEIEIENYGEVCSSVSLIYGNMGMLYNQLGEYDNALEYIKKSLNIRLKIYDNSNLDVALSYNNLGMVYYNMLDYEQARDCFNESLKIKLDIYKTSHYDIASTYNNLGVLCEKLGDYNESLEFLNKSLKMNLELLGESHPNIATNYVCLANVYRSKGDYEIALDYYKQALDIRLNIWDEHVVIADIYYNIAILYHETNRNMALNYYYKALDMYGKYYSNDHKIMIEINNRINDLI